MKNLFRLGFLTICLTVKCPHALKCFNCNETAECRDENFQNHDQSSVDCMFNSVPGFCIKLKWTESGKVSRYCQSKEKTPLGAGCLPLDAWYHGEKVLGCACNYRDNCNGPVGVENPQPGGLMCYDCYLNPGCRDDTFAKHNQTLVNCSGGSCIKTILENSGAVHRYCSERYFPTGCESQTLDGGVKAKSCACNKDHCNNESFTSGASAGHVTLFGLGLIISLNLLAA